MGPIVKIDFFNRARRGDKRKKPFFLDGERLAPRYVNMKFPPEVVAPIAKLVKEHRELGFSSTTDFAKRAMVEKYAEIQRRLTAGVAPDAADPMLGFLEEFYNEQREKYLSLVAKKKKK